MTAKESPTILITAFSTLSNIEKSLLKIQGSNNGGQVIKRNLQIVKLNNE